MTRQSSEKVLDFLRDRGYTLETIPTMRELRSLVGGSLATISRAVTDYRAELKRSARRPIQPSFKAIFDCAAEEAWQSAVAEASQAAERARQEAESLLDEMRKECDRLEGLNAELRAELTAVRAELKDTREAAAEQSVRAKVADENAERLVDDIRRLCDELAAAREAKAEAVGALKALKEARGLKAEQ